MLEAFLIPFITIALGEFLDKSQLTLLLLTSRTKRHLILLAGAMLGFLIVDGSAIVLGVYAQTLLPHSWTRLIAGLLFIGFGIFSLFNKEDAAPKPISTHRVFITSFSFILLAEFGDKTQLAAAVFATKYQPQLVFAGVMTAQLLLAILAIFVGHHLTKHVNKTLIQRTAAFLFILIGTVFLFS